MSLGQVIGIYLLGERDVKMQLSASAGGKKVIELSLYYFCFLQRWLWILFKMSKEVMRKETWKEKQLCETATCRDWETVIFQAWRSLSLLKVPNVWDCLIFSRRLQGRTVSFGLFKIALRFIHIVPIPTSLSDRLSPLILELSYLLAKRSPCLLATIKHFDK